MVRSVVETILSASRRLPVRGRTRLGTFAGGKRSTSA